MILGLDISTKLGWALLSDGGTVWGEFKHPYSKDLYRYDRYFRYVTDVAEHTPDVELAVTEKLVATRFGSALVVAEIGALVRAELWRRGIPVLEVPPTTLKKYVTGKGNADKSQMLMHMYKKWGVEPPTDNVGDAYALARLGREFLDRKNSTKANQAICTTLLKTQPYLDA